MSKKRKFTDISSPESNSTSSLGELEKMNVYPVKRLNKHMENLQITSPVDSNK